MSAVAPAPPKSFTLAFLTATISCNIISCGILLLFLNSNIPSFYLFIPFFFGIMLGIVLSLPFWGKEIRTDYSRKRRLRTFIHELKHAIVIILSGGKITAFHVYKDLESGKQTEGIHKGISLRGRVPFNVYRRTHRFKPFIYLAPYFLPLFSFPALIVAVIGRPFGLLYSAVLLGAALTLDLVAAILDYKKFQLDFDYIMGKKIVSSIFLFSFHLMWILLCITWVCEARSISA